MSTPLKNILRFSAIAALFTIFCLIGVRIIKNEDWLNIKRPIAGKDNINLSENGRGSLTLPTLPQIPDNTQKIDDNDTAQNPTENNAEQKPAVSDAQPSNTSDSSDSNQFTKVLPEYFDDALFIGDSRTVGLKEYGSIKNATFFASTGMDIYNIYSTKINVGKQGKIDLMSLLKNNRYSKVYIMLGINELGYNFDDTIKKYSELIDTIRSCQPDAIIYIEANMHVSGSRSASDSIFNNSNINKFNHMLASLADTKNAYYLDVNPLFDDANGNLSTEYTYDNTHVLGKHYKTWTDWISENAIEKPD